MDVTDGFTPETAVTLAAADEAELLKAAGAATVSIAGNTFAAITGADGWYDLTLTTTDTNTVGTLDVVVNDDSVCLPVFARFQVIEEAAYDAIYASNADPKADINVASIDANVITATSIAADAITAAKIADGAIDAATFAAGAITATVIATGAVDADALAADAVAEIADGVWDEDATGHQTQGTFGQAIGDPVADTNTIFKAVVTDATGATVGVDVVAVKADTAAILLDTGTDGVVVAAASKTGYSLVSPQTFDLTGNITGNLSGSVGSVTGAVGSVTGAVGSVTGSVGSVSAGGITAASIATDAIDADSLAADAVTEIANAVLTSGLIESYAADGAAFTLAQAQFMIWSFLGEKNISGTTLTAKKLDGITAAMTFTLDSDTAPTSITRAT